MTMLLGFNLGNKTYLSADTRVTYSNQLVSDDIQKISVLYPQKLIILAAGSANLASEIVNLIKKKSFVFPTSQENFKSLARRAIDNYKKKAIVKKIFPKNPLKPVILLIQYIFESKIMLAAYLITFDVANNYKLKIRKFQTNKGNCIKAGAIRNNSPISINAIPNKTMSFLLRQDGTRIEEYLEVTHELFSVAQKYGVKTIGGKTHTLMTRLHNGLFEIRAIKGFKTVIHSDDSFQDVSMYSDMDAKTGIFYLRDMRREGKVVSHLLFEKGRYIFRYDSCGPGFGEKDKPYKPFTSFSVTNSMDFEL